MPHIQLPDGLPGITSATTGRTPGPMWPTRPHSAAVVAATSAAVVAANGYVGSTLIPAATAQAAKWIPLRFRSSEYVAFT
jgi:hypothetical protein